MRHHGSGNGVDHSSSGVGLDLRPYNRGAPTGNCGLVPFLMACRTAPQRAEGHTTTAGRGAAGGKHEGHDGDEGPHIV